MQMEKGRGRRGVREYSKAVRGFVLAECKASPDVAGPKEKDT